LGERSQCHDINLWHNYVQGDSGSGLTVKTSEGMVLAGIMSSGVGCGLPKLPGVYTNVKSYVRWIKD